MEMYFDPDFDLASFEAKNADLVAKDQTLRELVAAARNKLKKVKYVDAVKTAHQVLKESEKKIEKFKSELLLSGGHEAWRKKHPKEKVHADEVEASRHFDAYDKARACLDDLQGVLHGRVHDLRQDEARAKWIAENPVAHAKELAALDKERKERLRAQGLIP